MTSKPAMAGLARPQKGNGAVMRHHGIDFSQEATQVAHLAFPPRAFRLAAQSLHPVRDQFMLAQRDIGGERLGGIMGHKSLSETGSDRQDHVAGVATIKTSPELVRPILG